MLVSYLLVRSTTAGTDAVVPSSSSGLVQEDAPPDDEEGPLRALMRRRLEVLRQAQCFRNTATEI